jgi:hypothetical protein
MRISLMKLAALFLLAAWIFPVGVLTVSKHSWLGLPMNLRRLTFCKTTKRSHFITPEPSSLEPS